MIANQIKTKAGKKMRSGDWYISELETALEPLQTEEYDIRASDTSGITIGKLFFFSYGAKYPDKSVLLFDSQHFDDAPPKERWRHSVTRSK